MRTGSVGMAFIAQAGAFRAAASRLYLAYGRM